MGPRSKGSTVCIGKPRMREKKATGKLSAIKWAHHVGKLFPSIGPVLERMFLVRDFAVDLAFAFVSTKVWEGLRLPPGQETSARIAVPRKRVGDVRRRQMNSCSDLHLFNPQAHP
ncbi:hypothetical protein KCU83_g201, partial [Aureobasidium melanogenum]